MLLNHQVGVAITQDPANAEFFGKPESWYERLVLSHVVGGGNMDLQHILSLSPLGEVRMTPAPKPVRILEPSKCIRQ